MSQNRTIREKFGRTAAKAEPVKSDRFNCLSQRVSENRVCPIFKCLFKDLTCNAQFNFCCQKDSAFVCLPNPTVLELHHLKLQNLNLKDQCSFRTTGRQKTQLDRRLLNLAWPSSFPTQPSLLLIVGTKLSST